MRTISKTVFFAVDGGKSVLRIWFGEVKISLNNFSSEEM